MDDSNAARRTEIKRVSEREITVTRRFDAPARIVFRAWSDAALFARWWVPKSLGATLRSCEMDVRTGGRYRLEFGESAAEAFAFYGTYTEVIPNQRIVWTNEEGPDGAVSTVTFAEENGQTLVTFSETYPSKKALEAGQGGLDGAPEQFEQLDELLKSLS